MSSPAPRSPIAQEEAEYGHCAADEAPECAPRRPSRSPPACEQVYRSPSSEYITRREAKEMEQRITDMVRTVVHNEVQAANNELMDFLIERDRRNMHSMHNMHGWLYKHTPNAFYAKLREFGSSFAAPPPFPFHRNTPQSPNPEHIPPPSLSQTTPGEDTDFFLSTDLFFSYEQEPLYESTKLDPNSSSKPPL